MKAVASGALDSRQWVFPVVPRYSLIASGSRFLPANALLASSVDILAFSTRRGPFGE